MTPTACQIVPTGKRRDGGTRYWCLAHRADATAKYGKRGQRCRYAHIPLVTSDEIVSIDISFYAGGVGVWGAVPPVYDTTSLPLDRGIHVHARRVANGEKNIDHTYRSVRIVDKRVRPQPLSAVVSELDAIYYMVTSVFGYRMKYIECTRCRWPHLDKDWFSVNAHRGHLCAGCGKPFRDIETAIGNPISRLRDDFGAGLATPRASKRHCRIKQSDYPGGIQLWGSNPAILWTGTQKEEEGIHVHAFGADGAEPTLDGTYSLVEVDGVSLDPQMVRTLMAQSALPHIAGRVSQISCTSCGAEHLDEGPLAFTPHGNHCCANCGTTLRSRGRFRNTIGNPLVGILKQLAMTSPRPPQEHALGLLPETL